MRKQPFFSIVIPTCNRNKELRRALTSVLEQTFIDYEIVITDNSDIVFSMRDYSHDSRIRYYKNKENIGFTRNLYKAIRLARGKYIFMLGDDDLLLTKSILSNVYKLIKRFGYGYVRLKFFYHNNFKKLYSLYFDSKKRKFLKKNEDNLKIINFIEKSIYNFISGLIFINHRNFKIEQIEKSNVDLSDFWIKYIFQAVKNQGGYIDEEDIIVAKWSNYHDPQFYNVVNNRLPIERVMELFNNYLSYSQRQIWMNNYLNMIIPMFFSIKYYTNNKNLIKYVKRILQINFNFYYSFYFYTCFLLALLMTKFIWDFLRKIYHSTKFINDEKILAEFESLKSIL